jgi:hypothetical protein
MGASKRRKGQSKKDFRAKTHRHRPAGSTTAEKRRKQRALEAAADAHRKAEARAYQERGGGTEWLPGAHVGIDAFQAKWEARHIDEPDDWLPCPWSYSQLGWDKCGHRLPWGVLKLLWREDERRALLPEWRTGVVCPFCDGPTLAFGFGFGLAMGGVSRSCLACNTHVSPHVSPNDIRGWVFGAVRGTPYDWKTFRCPGDVPPAALRPHWGKKRSIAPPGLWFALPPRREGWFVVLGRDRKTRGVVRITFDPNRAQYVVHGDTSWVGWWYGGAFPSEDWLPYGWPRTDRSAEPPA